ncbi:MAG: hypoxanthine phosphoribosyltransferase [Bacteroidales bacterium]|nr:hypoxanthine phosphoribosyltransferase [Bacteroidales bacterium]MBN2763412.1 hypoxanthine phosphoribosyltransferase [Bacteroidales bacterium]
MPNITIDDKVFSLYLPAEKIQHRVETMANMLNADLKGHDPVFIGVLNGAFMFAADLLKRIHGHVQVSFVKVASYRGTSSGLDVKRLIGLNEVLKGKTVVILEDIIDTGKTIEDILYQIKGFRPVEIRTATLLLKKDAYKSGIHIDYIGFEIPDRFVIGYGLDYNGYGRNLRNVYVLEDLKV